MIFSLLVVGAYFVTSSTVGKDNLKKMLLEPIQEEIIAPTPISIRRDLFVNNREALNDDLPIERTDGIESSEKPNRLKLALENGLAKRKESSSLIDQEMDHSNPSPGSLSLDRGIRLIERTNKQPIERKKRWSLPALFKERVPNTKFSLLQKRRSFAGSNEFLNDAPQVMECPKLTGRSKSLIVRGELTENNLEIDMYHKRRIRQTEFMLIFSSPASVIVGQLFEILRNERRYLFKMKPPTKWVGLNGCVDSVIKKAIETIPLETLVEAFHYAIEFDVYTVVVFLATVVNVESRDENGYCPIHTAAAYESLNSLFHLAQFGANIKARTDGGLSILFVAVLHDQTEIVNYLVDGLIHWLWRPIDPCELDSYGRNALFYADSSKMIKTLRKLDVPMNQLDNDGWSAFHYQAQDGNLISLKALLRQNPSIELLDHQTREGYSALHLAAMNGHFKCVTSLLKRYVNKDLKTNDGLTAIELARNNANRISFAKLLE